MVVSKMKTRKKKYVSIEFRALVVSLQTNIKLQHSNTQAVMHITATLDFNMSKTCIDYQCVSLLLASLGNIIPGMCT